MIGMSTSMCVVCRRWGAGVSVKGAIQFDGGVSAPIRCADDSWGWPMYRSGA